MAGKVKVIITDDQKDIRIPTGIRMLIRRCCNAVLKLENFEGGAEISVRFVNDEEIHRLNKEFRNVDAPTDVLSFPLKNGDDYDINYDT
ncbi:MAG TPA: rRNA maturation RNase YbeY, partial [Clostridiales bacterium]|nr:rRNA maturation RNase YbeY [Clostridiales bacterium]